VLLGRTKIISLPAPLVGFEKVTSPAYSTYTQPYLAKFKQRKNKLYGLFASTDATSGLPTAYVLVEPARKLSELNISFINRLGTLTEANPQTLGTNYAALQKQQLVLAWNVEGARADITPATRAQLASEKAFEATFGAIRTLTFYPATHNKPASLTLQSANGAPAMFEHIAITPQAEAASTLINAGRYTLTMPLQTKLTGTSASIIAAMLPAGSLLEISSTAPPEQPVGSLAATLWHPAVFKPLELTGAYDFNMFHSSFNYSYPLPSGGLVKARLTCQVLAGPVVCAAHNLHQPREQNILTVRGVQTRESLSSTTAKRAGWNSEQLNLLDTQKPVQPSIPLLAVSSTLAISATSFISSSVVLDAPVFADDALTPISPSASLSPSARAE
jgi:hypothetical protein